MKKKIINTVILLIMIICMNLNISYAIDVPEKNVKLKIENLTRGCNVYLLLPVDLLKFNMQSFIDNNIENDYHTEKEKAVKIKKYLEKEDYLGYIDYFKKQGFDVKENEIELRHYCFCLGNSEVIDYMEYNSNKYVQIKIVLDYNNEFNLITKDYLTEYDLSNIKFMIDEYGSKTYINLNVSEFRTNDSKPNVQQYNLIHTFYSNEDFAEIERATDLTYIIIWIILIIIGVIVFKKIEIRHKAKKQEIEDRKFWKKKLTKEEIKEAKKIAKEKRKQEKKNKKSKEKF